MVCKDKDQIYWFAMKDNGRCHAKLPAYKLLSEKGFEVFTPMRHEIKTQNGRRVRVEVPAIFDLLFVHSTKTILDPIVDDTKNLRYRYIKGGHLEPIIVEDTEMQRFIEAVSSSSDVQFYSPEEITPNMYGKMIRIMGGPLNGREGRLLSTPRGNNSKKRFLVELPGFLTAGVVVEREFIKVLQ